MCGSRFQLTGARTNKCRRGVTNCALSNKGQFDARGGRQTRVTVSFVNTRARKSTYNLILESPLLRERGTRIIFLAGECTHNTHIKRDGHTRHLSHTPPCARVSYVTSTSIAGCPARPPAPPAAALLCFGLRIILGAWVLKKLDIFIKPIFAESWWCQLPGASSTFEF